MNNKIKLVIVDDEYHSTAILSQQIKELQMPELELCAVFNDARLALDYLLVHPVDLLFLDIEMPFLNGFALLDKLKNVRNDLAVVFITAYDSFAVKAFQFSALDYLLKPANSNDIRQVVSKVIHSKSRFSEQKINFLESMYNSQSNFSKIVLSTNEGFEIVPIENILYIVADSNYSFVHIQDKKTIHIARTLKDFEQTLADHGFLRIHQSHLINMHKIVKYVKSDGGHVVMCNGQVLYVAKSKKNTLLAFFEKLL